MFTFYQNFNARREEGESSREAEMTGHDRFCQQRPGAATRRKRRAQSSRRTQSAIEIECSGSNSDGFANVRSVLLRSGEKSASVEDDEPPASSPPADEEKGYYQLTSKIDSLAKILFNRVYAVKTCKEQTESSPNGKASAKVPPRQTKIIRQNNGRQQYMALDQTQTPLAQPRQNHHHHQQQQQQQPPQPQHHHHHHQQPQHNNSSSSSSSSQNGGGGGGEAAGGYYEGGSSSSADSLEMEKRSRDRALSICRIYTRETPRYSLLKHLNNVGSRVDKHWFVVRDTLLKTDRLLTLAPLNRNCALSIKPPTRDVLNKLFLTLQHPYICPILDLEFVQYEGQDYVVLVQPINHGSVKDIIYGIERNCWNEDWSQKYGSRGKGLPIPQIQRMGRQVLEALVFLKERDFPTVAHLHSGNVIVQNGVARLAALENSLLGFTSRIHPIVAARLHGAGPKHNHHHSHHSHHSHHHQPLAPESIDTICFGHMLFEMTAGYELCTFEPTAANLADIQRYPQVLDCLEFIFNRQTPGATYPSIEELIFHDLFRNIDLRELRNASVNIFRPDTTIPISRLLDGIRCQKTPVKRLSDFDSEDMISLSSPESDRSENGSLLAQIYKELSITAV